MMCYFRDDRRRKFARILLISYLFLAAVLILAFVANIYAATVTIYHSGGQKTCTLREPGIVWSPSGQMTVNCVENFTGTTQPQPTGKLDLGCYFTCKAAGGSEKPCVQQCTK